MSTNRKTAWDYATAALLAIHTIVIALTFQDYGVTIDEKHSLTNGQYFLNWYSSGFQNRHVILVGNHRLYGSFFNGLVALVSKVSPFGRYETNHLLTALAGLAGIFVTYRIGRRIAGPMAGFFSALILYLTPVYYGHSFMNPKDIPFAALFLTCIYWMLIVYDHLPRPGARRIAALGLFIGLTLGIRVGAVMLFGYVAVIIVLWLVAQYRKNASYRGVAFWNDLKTIAIACVAIGAIAWLVMLVWWPYGQIEPVLNPLRAIRFSAKFTDFEGKDLFRGRFISSAALPWNYLPTWFAITLPEFYEVILSIGIIAAIVARLKSARPARPTDPDFQSKLLFIVFAAVFPVAMAIVMRPILYDGNRHFLFVIPPLAVLSGIALSYLLSGALRPALKIALMAVLAVMGAVTATDMIRLHPYQYVFFNRTSGGLKAALGRYDTDYWGESHKEGMDWLIANYKKSAPPKSIRVANTAADFETGYYIENERRDTQRFTPVAPAERPDIILSITRYDAHLRFPGKVLHVVKRMGTPLLYVVEVSQPVGQTR